MLPVYSEEKQKTGSPVSCSFIEIPAAAGWLQLVFVMLSLLDHLQRFAVDGQGDEDQEDHALDELLRR